MATATARRKHNKHDNKKSAAVRPAVEYPKRGEKVTSPDYTIRVFAPEPAGSVVLSIDGGPWIACRPSVGYWWFDWSGFGDGEHRIVAALESPDGERFDAEPREFFVELERKLAAP